jgi:hypothetical protein
MKEAIWKTVLQKNNWPWLQVLPQVKSLRFYLQVVQK